MRIELSVIDISAFDDDSAFITVEIFSPINLNSSSLKPLVVAAGDPNLIPEVIVGGFGSFATPFLFQVIPALSKLSSASLPVTFFDLKSTKTI